MQSVFLRPPKPLLGIALAAVTGILLADRWPLPLAPLLGGAGVIGLMLMLWPRTWLCCVFSGVVFFALHTLRYHHAPCAAVAEMLKGGPQPVALTGVVWSEPNGYR